MDLKTGIFSGCNVCKGTGFFLFFVAHPVYSQYSISYKIYIQILYSSIFFSFPLLPKIGTFFRKEICYMKKSFGLIFAVLLLFFCSCSPYDPTPYIPREYGDAFLCDGSFTLAGQEKASGEKGSGPAPQIL